VTPGQPGEALLRGPIVAQGYHNNEEANKASFTPDGWMRTGDVLRVEGDLVYVVDRKKVICHQSSNIFGVG
jgi:long-subunit acyl-CoA synthetase (AMP-forming)